jgi:hypothetical protein
LTGSRYDVEVLSRLWLTATATWGHRWVSSFGELPVSDDGRLTLAGRVWSDDLAAFSGDRILSVLEGFRHSGAAWPPTLPEFRAACAGIPTLSQVRAALRGEQRSGFAVLVWAKLDPYLLKRADAGRADRMLEQAYDEAVADVLAGRLEIPPPAAAIATDPDAAERQRLADQDAHDRRFGLGKYAEDSRGT